MSRNGGKGDGEGTEEKLSLRDYIAIFLAVLQTVALPLVVLIVILFILVAYSSVFR